jgi:hypothetical protein
MEEGDSYDEHNDDDYERWDYVEDMTGNCEDAPRACNHCSNYGCNAHPCN